MSAPDEPNISAEDVARASLLIADAFGLGDDAEPSTAWPVDEGDAVLAGEVNGDLVGSILLAVNEELIARITSEPQRLSAAFQAALDALATPMGIELHVGELGISDLVPPVSAEIRDGNKLCALVGLSLQPADLPAGDGGAVDGGLGEAAFAADYEPSLLSTDGAGLPAVHGMPMMSTGPLNVLHDVEMDVTVELGRTTMPIRELLALQPGMVVEIDRAAGAPIDVLVNGHLIACGEVVVIDEEFGIRITEIVADGHPIG